MDHGRSAQGTPRRPLEKTRKSTFAPISKRIGAFYCSWFDGSAKLTTGSAHHDIGLTMTYSVVSYSTFISAIYLTSIILKRHHMRVLVIGAAGLLGSNLCFQWEEEGLDVVCSYHSHLISFPRKTSVSLDIANSMEVFRVIKNISPDVIVHCAALANVDACEQNPNEAMRINSEGTTYIAQAAEKNPKNIVKKDI